MEWVGPGGVLDWQEDEYQRMGAKESIKLASWIKPKVAHKAMVWSFLTRRIPIVFCLRAEEKTEKKDRDIIKRWKPICSKTFPFEVTVSFMLRADRKGVIDFSLPHKLERAHAAIFRDGDQLGEAHGAALINWARGAPKADGTLPITVGGTTHQIKPTAYEPAWQRALTGCTTAAAVSDLSQGNAAHLATLAEADGEMVQRVRSLIAARLEELA